jgi:hypothetical protein
VVAVVLLVLVLVADKVELEAVEMLQQEHQLLVQPIQAVAAVRILLERTAAQA